MAISAEILERIAALEAQLKRLMSAHEALKLKYDQALEEKRHQSAMIARQRELLKNFQSQAKISKLVQSSGSDHLDIEALKRQIDGCIAEINHCISVLSE